MTKKDFDRLKKFAETQEKINVLSTCKTCGKLLKPFEMVQGEYCVKHMRELNQKRLQDENNGFPL